MHYTLDQIKQVATLNMRLHNIEEELKFFARVGLRYALDNCEIDLSIQSHNTTQCEKNKARYRVKTLTEDNPFAIILPYSSNHERCREEFSMRIDETLALRVLDVIIQQKHKQKEEVKTQLETILQLNQTPIQHLHSSEK